MSKSKKPSASKAEEPVAPEMSALLVRGIPTTTKEGLDLIATIEGRSANAQAVRLFREAVDAYFREIEHDATVDLLEWVTPTNKDRPWKTVPKGIFLPRLKKLVVLGPEVEKFALKLQEQVIEKQEDVTARQHRSGEWQLCHVEYAHIEDEDEHEDDRRKVEKRIQKKLPGATVTKGKGSMWEVRDPERLLIDYGTLREIGAKYA